MFNKNLASYIQGKLSTGYNINAIRGALYRWGYNPIDVDQTIQSIYSSKKSESLAIKKENKLIELLFKPGNFFEDPISYDLKKSMHYFLNSFLVVLLIQSLIPFLLGFLSNKPINLILASLLTNLSALVLFVVSLSFVFVILLFVYFFLSKHILKLDIKISLFFPLLFFSLLPYIVVNSVGNTFLYNLISVFNLSFGFFSVNIFLLWSLLLFSLGLSKTIGISFKKGAALVFVPFFLFLSILILLFYNATRLNLLWLVFEKF